MKRLFQRFRGAGSRALRDLKVYFEQDSLVCPECKQTFPHRDLKPLSFVACPHCDFSNFVPMRVGGFLLFMPLGAGGMASVYKSYHRNRPGELFAVKILKPEHKSSQDSIDAFFTEAEIHQQIPDHPNIVHYMESGLLDDEYYYAMEFVSGERLTTRIKSSGRMSEEALLHCLLDLVSALKHIYDHGYLYRDINAGNVILRDDGNAVLLDFGLTLTIEEALQESDDMHVEGTPEFVPPERLYQTGEDVRSVIYSLGMLAFYMLTAEFLIKAKTVHRTAARHLSDLRLASTPGIPKDCRPETVEMIQKMILSEPQERHQTLDELDDEVHRLLGPS